MPKSPPPTRLPSKDCNLIWAPCARLSNRWAFKSTTLSLNLPCWTANGSRRWTVHCPPRPRHWKPTHRPATPSGNPDRGNRPSTTPATQAILTAPRNGGGIALEETRTGKIPSDQPKATPGNSTNRNNSRPRIHGQQTSGLCQQATCDWLFAECGFGALASHNPNTLRSCRIPFWPTTNIII